MSDDAFVVMQIGTNESDRVFDEAIAPALVECGLVPRRADRHSDGGLLMNEILARLETSELVVADLTNERPSCYFEVGYAFGRGREARVVLTARADHIPGAAQSGTDGPKVHFDLAGYDILAWDPDRLPDFRDALRERARRRLRVSPDLDGHGFDNEAISRREYRIPGKERPSRRTADLRITGRKPEEQLAIDVLAGLSCAALGVLLVSAMSWGGARTPLLVYAAVAASLGLFGFFLPEHRLPAVAADHHRWLTEELRWFASCVRILLIAGAPVREAVDTTVASGGERHPALCALLANPDADPGWPWAPLYRAGVRLGNVSLQQLAVHAACAEPDPRRVAVALQAEVDALIAWILHDEGRIKAKATAPLAMMTLSSVALLIAPLVADLLRRR